MLLKAILLLMIDKRKENYELQEGGNHSGMRNLETTSVRV